MASITIRINYVLKIDCCQINLPFLVKHSMVIEKFAKNCYQKYYLYSENVIIIVILVATNKMATITTAIIIILSY